MKIRNGKIPYKNYKKGDLSIIDIELDKYIISVYKGSKGENPESDIKIVYYENGKHKSGRTPKHIHWAVDLLIKKYFDKKLTNSFINEIQKEWDNCEVLKNNDYETLRTITEHYNKKINISKYKTLNDFGDYKIDFLLIILILMMYEEKTSSPTKAHMFIDVLKSLLNDEIDIFSIISAATYHGGN